MYAYIQTKGHMDMTSNRVFSAHNVTESIT